MSLSRDPRDLYNPAELIELLGITLSTLYKWNHEGTGPLPIHIGRHVRYRPIDVDAWLDRAESQSKAIYTPLVCGGAQFAIAPPPDAAMEAELAPLDLSGAWHWEFPWRFTTPGNESDRSRFERLDADEQMWTAYCAMRLYRNKVLGGRVSAARCWKEALRAIEDLGRASE